jgi:hypothetical protein
MNRQELGLKIQLFGVLLFFITIITGTLLYIQNPYVFCIGANGERIEEQDKFNCFKTLSEHKAHAEYLAEKYPTEEKNLTFQFEP